MIADTLTVQLPPLLTRRLRQAAQVLERPVETVLLETLTAALPSLEDVPPEMTADITALARLDDLALWRVARMTISAAQQEKFRSLHAIQQVRPLTTGETAQFEDLCDEIGRYTLLKAEAYRLLHHRGYPVPQP